MVAPKGCDDESKEGRQLERHAGADAQRARLTVAHVADAAGGALGVAQQRRREAIQRLALGRQVHASLAIGQQACAEDAFERLDVKRDGRLAESQIFGGGREAAVIGDGDEDLQALQAQPGVQVADGLVRRGRSATLGRSRLRSDSRPRLTEIFS